MCNRDIKKVGNIVGGGKSQGGSTYLPSGISPTLLQGMSHGNVMPFIVEVKIEKHKLLRSADECPSAET